jgi:uncharacterized protein YndB with AHSA1/START domain
MTRTISVARHIDAPPDAVWAVLADFPNIAAWNSGVKTSYATSATIEGVGARRHCDLAPMGTLEETVREWEPGRRMVVSIDEARRLPLRTATATFVVEPAAAGTEVSIEYTYDPQGPVGPVMDRQLTKGFTGFLADLERAATASTG